MAAVGSDLLGEGLEEEKQEVSGQAGEGPAAPLSSRRYLGDRAAEAAAAPPWAWPRPLRLPAADMTADIMALMEDRSPLC